MTDKTNRQTVETNGLERQNKPKHRQTRKTRQTDRQTQKQTDRLDRRTDTDTYRRIGKPDQTDGQTR